LHLNINPRRFIFKGQFEDHKVFRAFLLFSSVLHAVARIPSGAFHCVHAHLFCYNGVGTNYVIQKGLSMTDNIELIVRLVLASLLGGIIGLEREVHGREAGVRTYLLVALGSALIMLVSEHVFLKYRFETAAAIRIDPGRIAAQAVTGIGFLGAGVILRYQNSIRGLTTAACMWVACGIGLAIGAGQLQEQRCPL
jgi:hypothetical protein